MTAQPGDGDPVVALLGEQVRRLAGEMVGPLRRLRMRYGEAVVEIEWQPCAPPGAGSPLAAPGAAIAVPDPERVAGAPVGAAGAATRTPGAHHVIAAPVVGTFYRSPAPGSPPFVGVGDVVEPGQVIGIVEAMKLMNQVTADQPGRVVEVLVADGEAVEYEQPLIALTAA
jgi:acetyl-CoA carboxylase biotin carboxyl carrier protein